MCAERVAGLTPATPARLGLSVVGQKDGTLEVSWGGGRCSGLRSRGPMRAGTMAGVAFRTLLSGDRAELDVTL